MTAYFLKGRTIAAVITAWLAEGNGAAVKDLPDNRGDFANNCTTKPGVKAYATSWQGSKPKTVDADTTNDGGLSHLCKIIIKFLRWRLFFTTPMISLMAISEFRARCSGLSQNFCANAHRKPRSRLPWDSRSAGR